MTTKMNITTDRALIKETIGDWPNMRLISRNGRWHLSTHSTPAEKRYELLALLDKISALKLSQPITLPYQQTWGYAAD